MIESKFGIKYINNIRCYKVDLNKRKYFLEYSSPQYMKIDDFQILNQSWLGLMEELFNYLIDKHHLSKEHLLEFSVDWSGKHIFSKDKLTNFDRGPLINDLFYNVNQSSTHLQWIIQDLLMYLGEDINHIELYVKIPTYKEDKEIISHYLNLYKKSLKIFLKRNLAYDMDYIKQFMSHLTKIDKVFNTYFNHQVSMLLLDNKHSYSMYKSKFLVKLNKIDKLANLKEKIKSILDDLTLFYAYIEENNHIIK
ncbi:hypothetical protein HF295_07255 [Hujiaoplasma nucleasis]|uniref:Uncharacterized protein n=1 Tax=Hujiaoplasma nucleasis TaxID=2725268 RepID=A0A7L6N583_9MOLU|nr:hypothetical protein [Hujiaoplasma nucleasis]QLY40652.1 hypothetical protein HF295_07255 [Hujiaoplasma nucleasis]